MLNEALLALIPMCAPDVAPNTIAQIIRVESRGDPLAINVNGLGKKVRAESQAEAARLTRYYINAGYSVDVGLMQVNSSNFAGLGYSHDRIEAFVFTASDANMGNDVFHTWATEILLPEHARVQRDRDGQRLLPQTAGYAGRVAG